MKKSSIFLLLIAVFLITSPAVSSGRFKDNRNGTITDTQTGLMWQQDGSAAGQMNWWEAGRYCKKLRLAGYSNWRLPAISELRKLINENQKNQDKRLNNEGFKNIQLSYYWSGTLHARESDCAWSVGMAAGEVGYGGNFIEFFVLAVRSVR